MTRTVDCVYPNNSPAQASSQCAYTPMPDLTASCNTLACETFSVYSSAYGQCSETCGGGTQTRTVVCKSSYGYTADIALCRDAGLDVSSSKACNTQACVGYFWGYDSWGVCNQTCGGGQAVRTVTCMQAVADNPAVVAPDASLCTAASKPDSTRMCNTAPCVVYAWDISDWTICSKTCGGGTMTRAVSCEGSDGRPAAISQCTGQAPNSTAACSTDLCDFCASQSCSGHGNCTAGACVCNSGYKSGFCEVPAACNGVLDVNGNCCATVTDINGKCCTGAASVLDSEQECCASGHVDVCGVCDGVAIVLDVLGECDCTTFLDPKGICCHSGVMDKCGVCDGDGSSCRTDVTAGVSADTSLASDPAFSSTLQSYFAGKLGVPNNTIAVSDISATGSSNSAGILTIANADASIQSSISYIIKFAVLPGAPIQATADISNALTAAPASNASTGLSVNSVASVQTQGVCGNGLCEANEACKTKTQSGCCLADCPYVLQTCPAPPPSTQECSGTGQCLRASGTCSCFTGYTGAGCDSCDTGYYKDSATLSCKPLASVYRLPASPPPQTTTPVSPPPPRTPSPPPTSPPPPKPSSPPVAVDTPSTEAKAASSGSSVVVVAAAAAGGGGFVAAAAALFFGMRIRRQRRDREHFRYAGEAALAAHSRMAGMPATDSNNNNNNNNNNRTSSIPPPPPYTPEPQIFPAAGHLDLQPSAPPMPQMLMPQMMPVVVSPNADSPRMSPDLRGESSPHHADSYEEVQGASPKYDRPDGPNGLVNIHDGAGSSSAAAAGAPGGWGSGLSRRHPQPDPTAHSPRASEVVDTPFAPARSRLSGSQGM
eukprot:jgi/Chlat1/4132/Chrsp269S03954